MHHLTAENQRLEEGDKISKERLRLFIDEELSTQQIKNKDALVMELFKDKKINELKQSFDRQYAAILEQNK